MLRVFKSKLFYFSKYVCNLKSITTNNSNQTESLLIKYLRAQHLVQECEWDLFVACLHHKLPLTIRIDENQFNHHLSFISFFKGLRSLESFHPSEGKANIVSFYNTIDFTFCFQMKVGKTRFLIIRLSA